MGRKRFPEAVTELFCYKNERFTVLKSSLAKTMIIKLLKSNFFDFDTVPELTSVYKFSVESQILLY
jgi:hypothetical protein